MISLNYSGIKNTLASFNILNITFNKKEKLHDSIKPDLTIEEIPAQVRKILKDNKTLLQGSDIQVIEKMNDDLIVYLFIQKDKDSSAWNLVVPVILERITGKITQFGQGYFSLEGSGGGLSNTDSFLYFLERHKNKGYTVSIRPLIIENDLLNGFEYVDSGVKLMDLLDDPIELIHYQKGPFKWIYKQYVELIEKHNL